MLVIGFYPTHLNERGTSIAVHDYATHNETYLGNKSIIIYDKNHSWNYPAMIEKFSQRFTCIGIADNFQEEMDGVVVKYGIDFLYMIKSGENDGKLSKYCMNLVHVVFHPFAPHGDVYTVVSKHLSEKYGVATYVPHMIDMPENPETYGNLRDKLGIPEDAVVLGRYGGTGSFNLDYAKNTVMDVVNDFPDCYFLFMNTDVFYEHPRVIHVAGSVHIEDKIKFINTCDAMLHASILGETFGLAVGEFSMCNKPIITNDDGKVNGHLDILGCRALRYRDMNSLRDQILEVPGLIEKHKSDPDYWKRYKKYSPTKVMDKFEDIFLQVGTIRDYSAYNFILKFYKNDSLGYSLKKQNVIWEPHIFNLLLELSDCLSQDIVCLDIGAHVGIHTLVMSQIFNKVHAFEPNKFNNYLLHRNLQINLCDNVTVHQTAISDEDKNIFLNSNDISVFRSKELVNMGDYFIASKNEQGNVTGRKLDSMIDELKGTKLIKIDIQGAEYDCLVGARDFIAVYRPYIIVEIESFCLARFGRKESEIFELFKQLNYAVYFIEFEYQSDHLLVPLEDVEKFEQKMGSHIQVLLVNNELNNNLINGVSKRIVF